MTSSDEPDWDAVRKAFDEARWDIDPSWTIEEAARLLARVLEEIRRTVAHRPALLAELRVALIVAGLRDAGWQQLVTWSDPGRSEGAPTRWPNPFDEAPHVIECAIRNGLAWMLDALVCPEALGSRQQIGERSPPRFEHRSPLRPLDLGVTIARDLRSLGIQELTYRLAAYATWASFLQTMVDHDRHLTPAMVGALSLLLSEHPHPPGVRRYVASRLSPEINAATRVGSYGRTRPELAAKIRSERATALEVYIRWHSLKRQGAAGPQEAAFQRTAQVRGKGVPTVRKNFRRHRWLVELWKELIEPGNFPPAPSNTDGLLLAMYEDVAAAAAGPAE